MKSHLTIYALVLFVASIPVISVQAQSSQEKAEVQGSLVLGKSQTRTLAPGTIHVWNIALEADQYAVVEVLQKSIDVAIHIIDPKGNPKGEFNIPMVMVIWGTEIEKAAWITDNDGLWKVKIASLRAVQPGEYEIRLVLGRRAFAKDLLAMAADSLNDLAQIYYARGNYSEAEPLFRRSLEVRKQVLGLDHPDVAMSLNNLGALSWYQGKYTLAESLVTRSLGLREKILDPMHPDLATSLNNLAYIYLTQGKYTEAEPLFKRSLIIREKSLGVSSPRVAHNFNNLADIYHDQGKYAEAELFYNRSLAILEKTFGAGHYYVSVTLYRLATLYFNQGKYAEAEPLYKQSQLIAERTFGPDHQNVAMGIDNLASLYDVQGKYAEAEPLYKRSLAIKEKAVGPDHITVASTLYSLAWLYNNQGKYTEAELFYKRSLSIWEKALGPDYPDVAASLNGLALLYNNQGKYTEAELLYKRSLSIWEKAWGPDHPNVAISLHNLALRYDNQGKYTEAEPLYKRSLAILEKALGPNHPEVALVLTNLASAMFRKGEAKLEIILPLIERAIGILEATIGHPDWRAYAYTVRARMSRQKGDVEKALADLAAVVRLGEKMRPQIGKSDETRAFYFEWYTQFFDEIVAWELQAGQSQKAFDYSERARAGVLSQAIQESAASAIAGIPDSLLQKDKVLKDQIVAYETEIQKTKQSGSPRDSVKIKNLESQLLALISEHDGLLKHLEKDYPHYYDLKYQIRSVSVVDLQENLSGNVTLLEYFAGDSALHIFVISKDQFEVVSLSHDSSFSKLVDSFYSAVRKADTPTYLSSAHDLYKLLIAPVEKHIAATKKLIIIPHNLLYKVPFEALLKSPYKSDGKPVDYRQLDYLVKHFDISYHYSATLYAKGLQERSTPLAENQKRPNAFLGFAPVFSAQRDDLIGYTLTSNDLSNLLAANDEVLRSITVDGRKFSELKQSEDEVKSIVTLFSKKTREQESIGYFYANATEQSFKESLKNYRYVHIATHSFVNEDKPALSGIIFAQPTDSTASEDGVLYAGETYNLDLNADLVVLSSCESGMGKLIRGEGLMALTRGFLYSGASNLIFSLWKVSDKPTRDLMVDFYKHLLDGKSFAQALRQAKLNMIAKAPTAAPRSWSSFVLIGAE